MASSTLPLLPLSKSPRRHHCYRQNSKIHCKTQSTTNSSQPSQIHQNSKSQSQEEEENETSSRPTKPTIRSRLSQLCKDGRPDLARSLFDTLPRPTTLLWNTIIIGFICNAMPVEALRLYARINTSKSPLLPDFYTYSSALKACADTRHLKLGKSVHCRIIRSRFKPNRILSNSLLNMYSTCLSSSFEMTEETHSSNLEFLRFDIVRQVFDRMPNRNVVAWNTVIDWYVKTGRPFEALTLFKLMTETGLKPTVVSFVNVFPAIAATRDQKNSNVLYCLLIKLGSDYVNDLFAVSSAIFMYSELSELDSARRVFDCSIHRNTEVWNTMIGGYVQNESPDNALDLFLQILHSDEVLPDTITFIAALMAVSQLQHLEFGRQIHAYVIKSTQVLHVILSNALMVMYSRCDSVGMAFDLFDKMPERDRVSWNTIISAFVQNGLDAEGLMLTHGMQKLGLHIDSVTATALLSAASNLQSLRIGKQIHGYLFRHGIQFEGMDSYLIDMYAKSGSIDTAQKLFQENHISDRDQVTWNAMIAGYTQNGQIEHAFTVLQQMLYQNQIPNSVTLASILPACNPVGGIRPGKQVHAFATRHWLDANVFACTALVDMYSKSGVVNYAERVFDRMPERNSVTYTTMISGYGQHGLGERALSLFRAMPESGMKPDHITFVAVLSACSYSGLVDEGLRIFESMDKDYNLLATPEHYCCVVDMLGRAGKIVEAYEFVKKIDNDDTEGNLVGVWGSLLGACRIHGEFELGKLVAERLIEMEKGNDVAGYHVLLSNIYAAEGKWESVNTVRKGMREKGLRKEIGCSWIEVGGVVHCFTSKDQKHPEWDEIYTMLEELAVEMKMADYQTIFELPLELHV